MRWPWEWNEAHQAGPNAVFSAIQKENKETIYVTCIVLSMVPVPGMQAFALVPAAMDVADGNYGTAAVTIVLVGAGPAWRLARGASAVAPAGMATARSPIWSSAAGDVVVGGANLPGSAGVQIARRLTTAEMEALTISNNVEFALIYRTGAGPNGAGGTYWLHSGTLGTVDIPLGNNVRWISHTHPGGTPFASGMTGDQRVLQLLQQAGSPQQSSVIIPVGGTPFRFNTNQTRLP